MEEKQIEKNEHLLASAIAIVGTVYSGKEKLVLYDEKVVVCKEESRSIGN